MKVDVSSNPSSALVELSYSPPKRRIRHRLMLQILVAGHIIAAIALVAVFTLGSFSSDATGLLSQVAWFLLITAFGTFVLFLVSLERSREIKNGVIYLELPIRRISGRLSRAIDLSEIVDVEFSDNTDGISGIVLILGDGSKVLLSQKGFGGEGFRILDDICRAFGKSYEEGITKILLAGIRYGFIVARLREVRNGRILLKNGFQTFSGTRMKEIELDNVRKVERVSTHYAGDGYLVWLVDGTPFILRAGEVVASGLPNLASWSSKLIESQAAPNPRGS